MPQKQQERISAKSASLQKLGGDGKGFMCNTFRHWVAPKATEKQGFSVSGNARLLDMRD